MRENGAMNIPAFLADQIAETGERLGAAKILLYGSRARGDNRERSDVDLAVYGMPAANRSRFLDAVENFSTLLEFDVVFVDAKISRALLQNIEKDGVPIMGKFAEKYDKFSSAVQRLREAIADYEKTPLDSVRDGVIQRFEFCTELAWKSTREYLNEQGYVELNSPKTVMKKAFSDGLVDDSTSWIDLLNDRNRTSHLYDSETAAEIFVSIKSVYLPMFEALLMRLGEEAGNADL